MAQSSISSSDLDLSMSLVSPPLKHPAYAHPSEFRKPVRTNSTPNGWRPSYIPHVSGHHYNDNRIKRNQSLREAEASKPRVNIDRASSTNSSNSSEQDSPVSSRYRTLYWSNSLLYHTSCAPSPKVSHKHLFCQVPTMDNPRKRLSHSSSIDSGTGTGSIGSIRRKKPGSSPGISPGRKRKNSIGSASTTSSSSLGSLKEKLEKAEPVEIKRRSSLASLLTRKSSGSRRSTTSTKKPNEDADGSGTPPDTSIPDPSSLSPAAVASSPSPSKSSSLRESFKAAKKLLTSSSKITTENPKISFSKNGGTISEQVAVSSHADASALSHVPPVNSARGRSNSYGKREDGTAAIYSVTNNGVSPTHHKHGSSQAKGLPGIPEKKQKDKDLNKSPSKNVLGKLFGKKNRGQSNISNSSHNHEESSRQPDKSVEKNSPKIVNFESEPRKIVPKPRIVTLSQNNRGYNEMEVSEEAVALAKKLREEKKQQEEAERKNQMIDAVIDEKDNDTDKVNNFSSQPPIPRPRRLSSTHKNNDDEETISPKTIINSHTKETSGELTNLNTDIITKEETNGEATGQSLELTVSAAPNSESKDGEKAEEETDSVEGNTDESVVTELPFASVQTSTPRIKDEVSNGPGSTDVYSCELDTQFGLESPCSSQDDHLMGDRISPSNDNNEEIENSVETENEEDNVSIATTVTTTASEMDTSFMLSRSLALTEDEFSYTESFKQLKPFNFDHVDPIPEGKRERLYKVLVVGELGTGKTSIIKRYVHQFFSQHYRATIGVDFALKVLRWDPETVVRLQLWDIAGQERFGSMTRVYYKEAVGAFVVFDVTRAATLEAVPKWKADLDTKVVLPDGRPIPTVLLANKSDQPKEGIAANREKMNEFCQQQGFSAWFETSAKDNINIDESANFLVSKILDLDKWSQEPMASDPEKLDLTANGKHKAGGASNCSC